MEVLASVVFEPRKLFAAFLSYFGFVSLILLLHFRLLVYEYVNNGNLEQWLHGAMRQHGYLTWEARMKVLLGTAKAYVAFFLPIEFS